VSIELPKYSIQDPDKKSSFIKSNLPLLMMACGLLIGYMSYKYFSENTLNSFIDRNRVLEETAQKINDKNELLEVEVSQLKAENLIKNEAVLQLQTDYKGQIDRQNELQSELSFYEQLLSPSAENKGLRVFQSKISDLKNNNFNLDLTLVQKIQKAKIITGRFEVYVSGKLEDKKKSIAIHLQEDSKYEFKYFHKFSLGFSLPKGFKAEQLIVKLFPQNKKSKLIERTTSWASLIQ
jgi:hypothetical protein